MKKPKSRRKGKKTEIILRVHDPEDLLFLLTFGIVLPFMLSISFLYFKQCQRPFIGYLGYLHNYIILPIYLLVRPSAVGI